MTENNEFNNAIPKARGLEKSTGEQRDTIPESISQEIFIPIKFNKEIKKLTVEQASELAQKGMKFETISNEYNALKELAQRAQKSVPVFLEELKLEKQNGRLQELIVKCSGDKVLAEHVLSLEGGMNTDGLYGFEELKTQFPEFKSIDAVPDAVRESARLKGTLLLDEYLRYCLSEKQRLRETARLQKNAENSSIGSQLNRRGAVDPEALEFLKGLWK